MPPSVEGKTIGFKLENFVHQGLSHFSLTATQNESLDNRGVQYLHWVMHKCITVKVGGKRNTHKVCKKHVNFSKTGTFFKEGEIIIFAKQGAMYTETGKMGGNSKFVVDD